MTLEVFIAEEPHERAAGILFSRNILEAQIVRSFMDSEYSMISRRAHFRELNKQSGFVIVELVGLRISNSENLL